MTTVSRPPSICAGPLHAPHKRIQSEGKTKQHHPPRPPPPPQNHPTKHQKKTPPPPPPPPLSRRPNIHPNTTASLPDFRLKYLEFQPAEKTLRTSSVCLDKENQSGGDIFTGTWLLFLSFLWCAHPQSRLDFSTLPISNKTNLEFLRIPFFFFKHDIYTQ